jgi:hypothetical protein
MALQGPHHSAKKSTKTGIPGAFINSEKDFFAIRFSR